MIVNDFTVKLSHQYLLYFQNYLFL